MKLLERGTLIRRKRLFVFIRLHMHPSRDSADNHNYNPRSGSSATLSDYWEDARQCDK